MTEILQPTREQLIAAWRRRNESLSRGEAEQSFDAWWESGALDPRWDADRGEWKILLRGITPLTNPGHMAPLPKNASAKRIGGIPTGLVC
jgi:hypothetical protein